MVAALKAAPAVAGQNPVRRLLIVALALLAPASPAQAATLGTWNRDDQHAAVDAGLMRVLDDERFHGERPRRVPRAALATGLGVAPVNVGAVDERVSVATFHRALVRQLGLADLAAAVQAEARRAGLHPPAPFGTEVVARRLGLRFDHPFPAGEPLELYPWDAITRAEAAYSLARVARFEGSEVQAVRDTLSRFVLPRYTAAQRRVLAVAVSKIGMPYIWGGETDGRSSSFGGQVHGGYDCSGLVWRVFKLSGMPAGRSISGRTAAQQAGEIRRAQRLRLAQVAPGDLLFFGRGRFWQRATENRITHEAIAMSADFVIHASTQGVFVAPVFEGRLLDDFAWARRVL
jgi:cell wall-associated NlpC family hydrolase